jgi:hypothetical protein
MVVPMQTPSPRAILLLIAGIASACGAAKARVPMRWGYELALQSDLSRTTGDVEPEGRAFPLSGSVVGTLRVPAGRRLTLVTGAGYEHRVRTEHITASFDLTGSSTTFELTLQRRFRSSVVPVTLEAELRPG